MSQHRLSPEEALISARTGLAQQASARQAALAEAAQAKPERRSPGPRGRTPRTAVRQGPKIALGPVLARLLRYARPVTPLMVLALLAALGSVLLTVLTPDYLKRITDHIQAGFTGSIDQAAIGQLVLTAGTMILAALALSATQGLLMARATVWVSRSLRSDMDGHFDRLPLTYFDTNPTGRTLSHITNDVDTLQQTLNSSISSLITGTVTLIGATLMMFLTSWQLALATIFASLLGVVGSGLLMARSQKYFVAQQENLGNLNAHIEESLTGHSVVRAYNAQEAISQEFAHRNQALFETAWKAQFLSGLMFPLMNFTGNLGYVVVCVLGSALVLNGSVSIGVVVAFILYVRIFTNPLGQIAQAATGLQSAAAAATRIFTLLDEEPQDEAGGSSLHKPGPGAVTFEQVSFGYTPEKLVIQNFSATVPAGAKVALVGPTGAGKTTLVNLLMRFYELNSGRILIDGADIATLPREEVQGQFGMVLQDTWLFEGSLRENLAYARPDLADAELRRVLSLVGLEELLAQLPEGLDTVLTDSSAISAGQKQLLTIARAMLADRPLLILDEATSSVDTRTELLIQRALGQLAQGRTSFVIAHRLSTIRDADLIFVMKDGNVVESGNHEQLLAAGGFYTELYQSQFDN